MAFGYVDSFRFVTQKSGIVFLIRLQIFQTQVFPLKCYSQKASDNATQVFQKQVFQIQIFHNPKRKKTNPKSKIQIKNQNVEKLQALWLWAKYQSWNHQKSCKVWLINAFGKNLEETLKGRWKNIRESFVCIYSA